MGWSSLSWQIHSWISLAALYLVCSSLISNSHEDEKSRDLSIVVSKIRVMVQCCNFVYRFLPNAVTYKIISTNSGIGSFCYQILTATWIVMYVDCIIVRKISCFEILCKTWSIAFKNIFVQFNPFVLKKYFSPFLDNWYIYAKLNRLCSKIFFGN